LYIVLDWQTKS